MLLKKGVTLSGVKPELVIGLMVADTIYLADGEDLTVTSITDGKHSKSSRHYIGLAADLRTNDISKLNTDIILMQLRERLPEFYILLENEGTPNEHIHMQFNGTSR